MYISNKVIKQNELPFRYFLVELHSWKKGLKEKKHIQVFSSKMGRKETSQLKKSQKWVSENIFALVKPIPSSLLAPS